VAMKRFNLLPPEQRVKASRERGLLYAILGLVVLVVVLGAVYMQQTGVLADKQAELDGIAAENAVVQQQIAVLQPYAQLNNLRTAMGVTALGIYDARVSWSNIIEEVSLVIPENVRLQTLSCIVPPAMLPGAPPAVPGGEAAASADVTFTGITYTHQDVAEFMTRLGLIPQLTNIQLTNSTGAAGTGPVATATTTRVTFTVTASLRAYLSPPPTTALQTGGGGQ
jgi:Tfp pilus assembly protein PilN